MTSIAYSLASDFSGNINLELLHTEILEETGITKTLDGINEEDDNITIDFESSLTTGEETLLDAVVAAHDGTTVTTTTYTRELLKFIDIPEPNNVTSGEGLLYKKIGDSSLYWKPELPGAEVAIDTRSKCFDAYYDPSREVELRTTWTDIPLNIERIKDSIYTHSSNSPEITIGATGRYMITARCSSYLPSTNMRTQSEMRIALDTGSGYNGIAGTSGYMYNREANEGYNTATVTLILNFNAGDKLKLQARLLSGSSRITAISEGSSFVICSI
jgi:hypothetical protein